MVKYGHWLHTHQNPLLLVAVMTRPSGEQLYSFYLHMIRDKCSLVPRLTPAFLYYRSGGGREKRGKAWSMCVITNDVHVGQGRHGHDIR